MLANTENERKLIGRNVALLWLGCAILLAGSNLLPAFGSAEWRSAAVGIFLCAGVWFVMSTIARRIDRRASPRQWGLGFDRRTILRFAIGLAIGSAMIGVQLANIALFGDIAIVKNEDFASALLVPLALSFLAWAAVEEVAFRSYALFRLSDAFGFWRAQILVAVVFALYHVAGGVPLAQALLGTGVGSLAFGAAAIASRGLALPIGLHAAWNIGEWLVGSKGDRFPSPWSLDISSSSARSVEVAGVVGYFVVFGCVTAAFWFHVRQRRTGKVL